MDNLERIKSYLLNGGLVNPELMEHEKVRDLLMSCRDEIELLRAANSDVRRIALERDDTDKVVAAVALGSAAWLRSEADTREKMLHIFGSIDPEGERETKREILGLRDAAGRMDLLDATLTACHAAMIGKVSPKSPAWKMISAAQDSSLPNTAVSQPGGQS